MLFMQLKGKEIRSQGDAFALVVGVRKDKE